MKKVVFVSTFIFLSFAFFSNTAVASTLSCSQVDGMAIFGNDGSKWEYIGAIANKYDTNSIANKYGAGSKYDSKSILNEYGDYGSEYSSYSAFNEYTSDSPIIVNDNYKFVGYLTINKYNTPNINTYEAISCAQNSYTSSNSKMEDITFIEIPKNSSSYTTGGYSDVSSPTPTPTAISCPANSSSINGQCVCNSGYRPNGNQCIPTTKPIDDRSIEIEKTNESNKEWEPILTTPPPSRFLDNFKTEVISPPKEVRKVVSNESATVSPSKIIEESNSKQIKQSFLSKTFNSVKNFFSRLFK